MKIIPVVIEHSKMFAVENEKRNSGGAHPNALCCHAYEYTRAKRFPGDQEAYSPLHFFLGRVG
jgi:hypothetical protein